MTDKQPKKDKQPKRSLGGVHSLGSHLPPIPDKGVTKEVSHRRTTNEPIPSTISKEAADIIRRVQKRTREREKTKG
tara:strand:+ start:14633 stop:14860 length:228 start_codon:yes stop_codon:yes gene_type:complete